MGRYAATFGMLGFLATIALAFFNEATITVVISQAVFWTVVCALAGVAISVAAKKLVAEIELPTVEDEIEAEKHQRDLAKYRERMKQLAEQFPRTARESHQSQKMSPEVSTSADKAEVGDSSPEPQSQAAG